MNVNSSDWRDPSARRSCEHHLAALARLLERRFPYLNMRSSRMRDAGNLFAKSLGLGGDASFALSLAARFHNLGMLGLSDALVMKNGPYTPEEMALVKAHTGVSGRLVSNLFPDYPEAAEAIWFHKERPDGRGPHGLTSDDIPKMSGVVALIQALEAMLNGRPHRRSMTFEAVQAEVEKHCGTQFDAQLVAVYRRNAREICKVLTAEALSAVSNRVSTVASQPADTNRPAATKASGAAVAVTPTTSLEDLKPIITKEVLVRLVTQGLELRPLATCAQAVLSITGNAQCTAEDVADAVRTDQALAIRILKLANSAMYARGRAVSVVSEAVKRIGIQQIRNLVLTLTVLQEYESRVAEYVDPCLFWEHSISCGIIGKRLASACDIEDPDNGFLSGVLHDIGRLVLVDHVPERYADVWEVAAALGQPLELVETRMMLLDHGHILERALDHWKFPRDFTIPIVNHHRTIHQLKRLGPKHYHSAVIVSLADRLSHAMLLGTSGNDVLYPVQDLMQALGQPAARIREELIGVEDETAELTMSMLARSGTDPWPDLSKKFRAKLERPVRPLHTDLPTDLNLLRLFFDRISDSSDEQPYNLGVVFVPDGRAFEERINRHEATARKIGVAALPLLLITEKGTINPEHAMLKQRSHRAFRVPLCLSNLVTAVNELTALAPAGGSPPPTASVT